MKIIKSNITDNKKKSQSPANKPKTRGLTQTIQKRQNPMQKKLMDAPDEVVARAIQDMMRKD